MRRKPAEYDKLKPQIINDLADGKTVEAVAEKYGVSTATVSKYGAEMRAVVTFEEDFKKEIKRRVTAYATSCFDTLDSQVRLLGERAYIEAHGTDIFSLSQSHRIVGEQLARFLAAIYG